MSHPSRKKGYAGEVKALETLVQLGFTKLARTGSVNYKDSAPDLVYWGAKGIPPTYKVRIVTTQDDYGPVLITMSAADFGDVLESYRAGSLADLPVVVQCKKRKTTTIGTLWKKLKEATS